MPRRMTKDEFIVIASKTHNNKYDYSRVEYINNRTKVCIICPIHGEFWQSPAAHIHLKQDCPKCALEANKSGVLGVGINDYLGPTKIKGKHLPSYACWRALIARCYDVATLRQNPTYSNCVVCDEWLYFSKFKEWFDNNYRDGYELDKDILSKDGKCYSPQTCLFVPKYINNLFRIRKDGKHGMGVRYDKITRKYFAVVTMRGKTKYGRFFDNKDDAYKEYKIKKQEEINHIAKEALYKGEIDERTYQALINYEVN